jgi:hypothetical protein
MMIATRLRESQAWWLASELTRRTDDLNIITGGTGESHVGVVHAADGLMKSVLEFAQVVGGPQISLSWDAINQAESLSEVLERIELQLFGERRPARATTPERLVHRLLARAVGESAVSHSPVRAIWGMAFFPHGLNPVNTAFFSGAFDHILKRWETAHHSHHLNEGLFGPVEDAFEKTWVLVKENRPVLLLDGGGWVHDPLGGHKNLAHAYAANHDLRAVFGKLIAPSL